MIWLNASMSRTYHASIAGQDGFGRPAFRAAANSVNTMIKKLNLLAIASLLLIPAVTILGVAVSTFINPEWAVRTSDYVRNYHLLDMARSGVLLATLLADIALWFTACFLVLKSKKQSRWWLAAGLLGPIGLIVLSVIPDHAPSSEDLYQRFLGRMKAASRIAYEIGLFVVVWISAFTIVSLITELRILGESIFTGTPRAQIVNVQLASSGMYAFGEFLEVTGLVVFFYLTFPVVFNVAGRLLSFRAVASGRSFS